MSRRILILVLALVSLLVTAAPVLASISEMS
jgi:hypothetical protein